jgi:hypothetical protein
MATKQPTFSKFYLFFLCFSILLPISSKTANPVQEKAVVWHGYSQLRFTSNFSDVHSFSLRRLKLWIKSEPTFDKHWGFKVQTTLSSSQNEKFVLQDVEGFYKGKQFSIHFGQFVPHYSLQRFQHDYNLAFAERFSAINALIPNGTLGVRDIGIEGNWRNKNKTMETWFGLFNGTGITSYKLNNSGILLTHKTNFYFFGRKLLAGYSLMYRKADQLQLIKIMPSETSFSGNDFRYNIFLKLQLKNFVFQTEYLAAELETQKAEGYYFLASYSQHKNVWALSYSNYSDLILTTASLPEIHLAYNYLLNKKGMKLLFDNGFSLDKGKLSNYSFSLQMQIFFN